MVSEDGIRHYTAIKSLSRLLSSKNSNTKHKQHFCMTCLQGFMQESSRDQHQVYCENNESVRVEMPKQGSTIEFKDGQNQFRVPFIMYTDFESILELMDPVEPGSPNPSQPYTNEVTQHTPSGWCVYSKFAYRDVNNLLRTYRGKDCIETFCNYIKGEAHRLYHMFPELKTFVPICNFNKPISITQCFVETNDIVIDPIPEYFNDNISPCDSNACLTCNSFISDQSFKSNLTGRIYKTQTYEQLTCGSSNVVYAIHCIRCGLMYVGETGRSLRSRINGHRAGIIKDGQSLLYKHFHLPGHSAADMKVQILEKIYHSSENSVNIQLHRRLRELHWIKELGTVAPYGCNDQIKGVGTLSSPSCKHTNVLGIFNKQQRRKRSHGHQHYNKKAPQLDSNIDTMVNLIDLIDQPQGVHKIKTTLFSISLLKLRELQSLALESSNYNYESAEYRVTAIILDTAHYWLFRPVRSDPSTAAKTHFIKLDFINKGIDAVNLPSILRSKSVTETVPTYFKEKEPPIISYTYTKTIASKIFNFSSTLSDLDYHQFHNNPTQCECNTSSHLYQPYGHVITGDLSIIPNSKLRDLIAKGPKYREPCKVDWDKNLSLLCEAVDQYTLQWTKREMVELSVLSSWKEMVKGQIEERISKLKQNFKQPTGKVLQNVDAKACLSDLHNKCVFVPADKAPNNIIIICKRYYIKTLIKELGLDNFSTTTGN